MISPFDMYFASTPVIVMKSTGCWRFPQCPRAGGAGRMIFFKGQKAVLWTRANRDVVDQDFSDLRPSVQDAEFRRQMKSRAPFGAFMTRRSVLAAFSLASGNLLSGWKPDGLGYRARIGLLTPNDDAVPESEFWTMAPEGVSVHVGRVLLVDTRTFSDPPHPDDATALLAALPMQAIVFAFTTTSYLLGSNGERALKARLEKRSNGIPVLLPCPGRSSLFVRWGCDALR